MTHLHHHNKLLLAAEKQLFPDIRFESQLKSGLFREEYMVERDYRIRLALPSDINELMEIERQCWAAPLQTDRAEIEQRLVDPACFTFVLENCGVVRGVIYTQRIYKESIKEITSATLASFRQLNGNCVQFIALNIATDWQDKGWGNELLEFVLQYFSLHPEIDHIYAVTRCRDVARSGYSTIQEYLKQIYKNGLFDDPILKFHQLHGAKVLGLLTNYRPKDIENSGYGVLIEYDINHRVWGGIVSVQNQQGKDNKQAAENDQSGDKQLLELVYRKLAVDYLDERQNLSTLGLDSLDLGEIVTFLHNQLGLSLSLGDLNRYSLGELLQLCRSGEQQQAAIAKNKTEQPSEQQEQSARSQQHILMQEHVQQLSSQSLKQRLRHTIRNYPEVVPLYTDGDGPITFWIHPLSGDVGVYNQIASLADGAFKLIAIKARGFLSSQSRPLASVQELAKYYCEIVTSIQPKGPYHLAGFSFGGTVAYEMARQLQLNGECVDSLVLVESPLLSDAAGAWFATNPRNNLLMNANFLLLSLLNRDSAQLRNDARDEIDWQQYQITEEEVSHVPDDRLALYLVFLCKQKGVKQAENELLFKLQSMAEVHQANLHAMGKYRAQPLPMPQQLKSVLFHTQSAKAVSQTLRNPDYLERIQQELGSLLPLLEGWSELLPNMQTIILAGDNHLDLLQQEALVQQFYNHCKTIFTSDCLDNSKLAVNDKAPSKPLDKENREAVEQAQHLSTISEKQEHYPAVAIIGMSGIFPDADNVRQLWENLRNGRSSVKEVPKDRGWDIEDYYDPNPKTAGKTYSKWGGFLADIDKFDPLFFKISPRDAQFMDPSERLFIQEAWRAIEDAGYDPQQLSGKPWGVYCLAKGDYSNTIQQEIAGYYVPTDSYPAGRLSYLLNFTGPAMSIDTACSSTLTVVAEACNHLVMGNCEVAIAGGGSVYTTPSILVGSSQSLLFSPDGVCYSFDERANGTVVAEAIGVVVLKLLDKAIADNDHIYGVIRGWGINQDGKTNGITAPSKLSQIRLQTSVYEKFGIDPRNITMIEAHGTGTKLGDAIEYEALTESFRQFTTQSGYCALGSLKSNIGHAFFGAGIAGLIKVLLSLKHRQIPPTLNYEHGNSSVDERNSPFFVNTELIPWETTENKPRCAAINSFGATGTNVHLVVEEYIGSCKEKGQAGRDSNTRDTQLFVLSAKDENRLNEYVSRFIKALDSGEYIEQDLPRIAYTLQVSRSSMSARIAFTASSLAELRLKLLSVYEHDRNDAYIADLIIYRSSSKTANGNALRSISDKDKQEAIDHWIKYRDGNLLLQLWVNGAEINWYQLYDNATPQRISLPTYPFAKERCWISSNDDNLNINGSSAKKDLVKQNALSYRGSNNAEHVASIVEPTVSTNALLNSLSDLMLFTEDWVNTPLSNKNQPLPNTVVCLLSNPANQALFKSQLQAIHPQAKIVFLSRDCVKVESDRNVYYLAGNEKEDYEKAFHRIKNEVGEVSAIVYMWAYEERDLLQDYRVIVHILQGISSAKLEPSLLLLGSYYQNQYERCYLESWIGFERSIGPMVSKTSVKAVIQQAEQKLQTGQLNTEMARQLCMELDISSKSHSVLYKKDSRYELKLRETDFTPGYAPLKTGGTYWITGGFGKLGMIVACHLAKQYRAKLIINGRSPFDEQKQRLARKLEQLGGRVYYIQADIVDTKALSSGLAAARLQFGAINGVIHAAGLVDPQSILHKDYSNFEAVIAPKIHGTLILDELLKEDELDFTCYFSSSAAILGDFGTCDYAIGNRFLMAYAYYKNLKEAEQELLGRTVVINWPLWRNGGMGLEDNNEKYLTASGQRYLESEEGMLIFEQLLSQPRSQHLVLLGERKKVQQFLNRLEAEPNHLADNDSLKLNSNVIQISTQYYENSDNKNPSDVLLPLVVQDLKEAISSQHHLPIEKLDENGHLTEYGFDSINLFEFADKISNLYGVAVTTSSLLGYATIKKIAQFLIDEHQALVAQAYHGQLQKETDVATDTNTSASETIERSLSIEKTQGQTEMEQIEQRQINVSERNERHLVPPREKQQNIAVKEFTYTEKLTEPIAIIGMSGRFPGADSIDELWHNLSQRKESITELPSDRWYWKMNAGAAANAVDSYSSRGGFLKDIDCFDPLFFKISPKEAHMMDPCQRLFLEEAWRALEDAGYMGERIKGTSCGVYVGIEEGEYGFIAKQQGKLYSNQNAVLSARIAYLLDLKGPNLSVTASCSSSLVALHQACQALRQDDCEMALVGGINLFLSPTAFIGMEMLDLLSPTGNCYVFDERAEGMVPSEAVVAVLLKPLSKALRDNDHIYGCIKASGVNYNGRGHGMMTPNPVRQAELIRNTLSKYDIDPAAVQYILAHSVGTKLGDAAEIEGLRKVFGSYAAQGPLGYISSVKPLIGHTFAASGLVSLVTMVKAMNAKTMLGLHHFQAANSDIDFASAPFIACSENQEWITRNNMPRLGAISTSANSGTNAFAVIEEFNEETSKLEPMEGDKPYLFIFSAVDHAQLHKLVDRMRNDIAEKELALADLAYTLQVGREEMEDRLAIVARTKEQLLDGLTHYLQYGVNASQHSCTVPVIYGSLDNGLGAINTNAALIANDNDLLISLATQWVQGKKIDWELVLGKERGKIVPLATYPFKKERYWLAANSASEPTNQSVTVLTDSNEVEANASVKKLQQYIIEFFADKLEIPISAISPNRELYDLGADSILMKKFIRDVQQRFALQLSSRELYEYSTINAISTYLSAKLMHNPDGGTKAVSSDDNELVKLQPQVYQDKEVIEALEKFVHGDIKLDQLEQLIGVDR